MIQYRYRVFNINDHDEEGDDDGERYVGVTKIVEIRSISRETD